VREAYKKVSQQCTPSIDVGVKQIFLSKLPFEPFKAAGFSYSYNFV
jgi:hypothetical protein